MINEELVRTGFAYVRGRRVGGNGGGSSSSGSGGAGSTSSLLDSKLRNDLIMMEQYARMKGLGIYQSCKDNDDGGIEEVVVVGGGGEGRRGTMGSNTNINNNNKSNFVAEFEPMEYSTEIQYGDDGGRSVLRRQGDTSSSSSSPPAPPDNPGDSKGCSDFRMCDHHHHHSPSPLHLTLFIGCHDRSAAGG